MAIILPEHSLQEIPDLILKALALGSQKKKHPFKTVVLSTLSGVFPNSRWVVCRRVTPNHHIHIYTDVRSNKVKELHKQPQCQLLFYNPRHGLQVQLQCNASIHYNDELTQKYWPGVMGSSYQSYTTIQPPGSIVDSIEEGQELQYPIDDRNFAIIELIPHQMEVLQICHEGHIRARFNLQESEWKGTYLVP
jgi:pyridoxine/pyridoxamine 5'-phosphate oxidase